MARIAIIDDNKDARESYKIRLSSFIRRRESTVEVIDAFPFEDFESYFSWIENNEICALVLDERLHLESEDGKGPVDYKGSELVKHIRAKYKDLPIFTLTAYIHDKDLMDEFGDFDYIIKKGELSVSHIDIILRATQRYLDENKKELSEYDLLTRKVATGDGNDADFENLRALQVKLQLPFSDSFKDRKEWLDKYEEQIVSLEKIKNIIEENLKKK